MPMRIRLACPVYKENISHVEFVSTDVFGGPHVGAAFVGSATCVKSVVDVPQFILLESPIASWD
jgi:hypothetical protein